MTDTENGRVTLAILATKLDNIDGKLDDYVSMCRDLDRRVQAVERETEVQKTRSGILAGLNAALTALVGVVMSVFRN